MLNLGLRAVVVLKSVLSNGIRNALALHTELGYLASVDVFHAQVPQFRFMSECMWCVVALLMQTIVLLQLLQAVDEN